MNTGELNEARRKKYLAKLYNFNGQIMTLEEKMATVKIVSKSQYVRYHEEHRRGLEYREIKPVTEYSVWWIENGREVGLDVPKLVWEKIEVTA